MASFKRIALVSMIIAFYMCTPGISADNPKYGGTLTFGQFMNIQRFDPTQLGGGGWALFYQVFDVLARYDKDFNIIPQLAESWKYSDDGLTLTFQLRKGVKFHTGRELVADDVVFSLERTQDKKTAANVRPISLSIKKAEAVDKHTVAFRFDKPNAAIFDLIDLLFIVDKETIDQIDTRPVGTGPFKFTEWLPGTHVRFVKFNDYWKKGRPYLDEVVIKPFTDQQAMVVNLETGVIDLIARPLFSDVKRLKEKGKYKVDIAGGLANDVMFNVKAPPYDNKKVRQAINYAIDRKKFTDMYYYGFSEPWYLPVPKHSLAYFPEFENKYEFNLEKAKQLLTEAGYPDGFEDTMVYSTRKAKGSNVLAQIMQADLRKIGIRLKLRDYEPAVMRPMEFRSEFTIHPHVYGRASKDPAGLFGSTVAWSPLPGIAIHQFQDEGYAKLLEEGQSTIDMEKRKEIYKKVIALLLDECFTIPISAQPLPYVMQHYVNGMKYNQDSYPQMEEVWIDK